MPFDASNSIIVGAMGELFELRSAFERVVREKKLSLDIRLRFHRILLMHQTIPQVSGGRLDQLETGADPIVVGTPAWYDWLEQHTVFLFVDPTGTFTAYKNDSDPSD